MRQRCPNRSRTAAGRLLMAACLAACGGCSLAGLGLPRPEPPTAPPPEAAAPPALPGKHSVRVSQYVFYTDLDLPADTPLFRELAELREQVYRELMLPPADTVIQVFLFRDQGQYQGYMRARYPELPRRRAFFIAQPRGAGGADELLVFTYWGGHVRQDLRHELTHALLHSVLPDVPLWLDEGLAEFFELPPEKGGVNRAHLDQLRAEPFAPDLARLERLREVHQMKQPEYREAWAWVHLMLRGSPEARRVLLGYLRDLRTSPQPGALLPRLAMVYPDLNGALAAHVARIEAPSDHARR